MLKRALLSLLITGLALELTGCAIFGKNNFATKRRTEYLRSQAAAPLQVPAGLNAQGVGDDYVVPASAMPAPVKPIGILPPDSMADKLARGVITKDTVKKANDFADAKSAPTVTATTTATSAAQPAASTSNNILPLNQTVAQVWKPVGEALKRAGYKIAVADEKLATYYILDMHATDEMVTKATPIYQVKLQSGADGNAYAYVVADNGNAVTAETSQRILTDLSNGLAGKGASTSFKQMLAPVTRWFKEAF